MLLLLLLCCCSSYGPSRAGQSACILLHTMWKHSDLHGSYKKVGLINTVQHINSFRSRSNRLHTEDKSALVIKLSLHSVASGKSISSTPGRPRWWAPVETESTLSHCTIFTTTTVFMKCLFTEDLRNKILCSWSRISHLNLFPLQLLLQDQFKNSDCCTVKCSLYHSLSKCFTVN